MGDIKLKQDMTNCRIYQLPREVAKLCTFYHSVHLHTIKIILHFTYSIRVLAVSQRLSTASNF